MITYAFRFEEFVQQSCNRGCNETRWTHPTANSELLDSIQVIGLIVGKWHNDLRDTSSQALRHGADASMMNRCRASWENQSERSVVEMAG